MILTGHVKSNGNRIGLTKLRFSLSAVRFMEFSPTTGVITSPNVHGDDISIFAW